jgi:holliday junction DNA helicase RuvA
MIYLIGGILAAKNNNFAVVDVGGIGYKININQRFLDNLPEIGSATRLSSHLHVKEDALDLYGFTDERELVFFEQLLKVSGVGPRSAMNIMSLASVEQLAAAINEGKTELLSRAAGIGKKTAERLILELRGKLATVGTAKTAKLMESDMDVEEALSGLGYSRAQAKKAVAQIDPGVKNLEGRLKEALKKIKN